MNIYTYGKNEERTCLVNRMEKKRNDAIGCYRINKKKNESIVTWI